MIAVIVTPAHVELFVLSLRSTKQQGETLYFRKEKNLLEMFPESKWQGRAGASDLATYTRSYKLPEEIAEMGNLVFENVYPETL